MSNSESATFINFHPNGFLAKSSLTLSDIIRPEYIQLIRARSNICEEKCLLTTIYEGEQLPLKIVVVQSKEPVSVYNKMQSLDDNIIRIL